MICTFTVKTKSSDCTVVRVTGWFVVLIQFDFSCSYSWCFNSRWMNACISCWCLALLCNILICICAHRKHILLLLSFLERIPRHLFQRHFFHYSSVLLKHTRCVCDIYCSHACIYFVDYWQNVWSTYSGICYSGRWGKFLCAYFHPINAGIGSGAPKTESFMLFHNFYEIFRVHYARLIILI